MDDDENKIFTVWATVTLRGAWMNVEAKNVEEAREIAERHPDFEMIGAEMADWVITGVQIDG